MLVVVHTVIIYVWTVLSTIIFGFTAIVTGFFSKTGDTVHRIARIWGRSILWISIVKVQVKGLERIDPKKSYIFMSNHQSNFDIPVLLNSLPVQFRWLAKAELYKIPIFGRGMRGAGYISIDRSNRKSAFQSLKRAAQIIRNGTSVLIFPEGTRSCDGQLLPFKKGGFVMATDAGVPIVPLCIRGTHAIMAKGSMLIFSGAADIIITEPIETSGYTRKEKEALMQRVREAMTAACQ